MSVGVFCCIKPQLCALGVRKDRGRVLRRDKRRTGISDKEKVGKDLEQKTVPPQDGRKHSSSTGGGVGKSSVTHMSPDEVLTHSVRIHSLTPHSLHGLIYPPCPQVLLLLQGAEPPILCSRQKLSRPYTEVTMMTLLTSMADKELVHMIAWAKKLPG